MAAIDTDGDGEISEEERAAARTAMIAEREARRAERFDAKDTDGNGSLDADELSAALGGRSGASSRSGGA